MEYVEPLTKEINYILGALVGLLSMIFGEHWFVFAFFLALNVSDFITGWIKFRQNKTESSVKGLNGVIKKFGYWVLIALSFGMSVFFIEIGKILNLNLEVTKFLGYFVLGSLIINEIRSNFENLVEAGYHLPDILVKSLEVADKAINKHDGSLDITLNMDEDVKDKYHFNFDVPLEELQDKDEVRLKINKKIDE